MRQGNNHHIQGLSIPQAPSELPGGHASACPLHVVGVEALQEGHLLEGNGRAPGETQYPKVAALFFVIVGQVFIWQLHHFSLQPMSTTAGVSNGLLFLPATFS